MQYNVEEFGIENNDEFYAGDESFFTHHNNEQIWVLDIVKTNTKDFRIVVIKNRDSGTLKE